MKPFVRKGKGTVLNISLLFVLLISVSCAKEELAEHDVIAKSDDQQLTKASTIPTIVVTADQTVNVSGKNDMAVLRNFFNSGTTCEDNLSAVPGQKLYTEEDTYLDKIGVNAMRSINGERSGTLDAKGNFVPSPIMRTHLNSFRSLQRDAHIVVGQQKPACLSGNAWSWNAAQWNAYENYAYKFLKYVMVDYQGGFNKAIIEVSNEVDIAGSKGYWFTNGGYSNGDMKGYNGLLKCYAEWSDAVKRFNRDYPGRKVRLFGPAITVYTIWWNKDPNNWALKFIEDCKAKNYLLDGITFHQYGAEKLGSRPDYSGGKNPSFMSTITKIQNKLNSAGFSKTEIHITEWGCSNWINTARVKNNYRPVGGAFAAAFMHDALTSGVDGMIPLRLRDPNGSNTWTEIGSLASNNGVIYPKPIYNVFRMFYQMPGDRKKADWQNPNCQLGAIASSNSSQTGVIVYNYDWDDKAIVDRCKPREVQVKVVKNGVSGNVRVRRFVVDSQHSNLAKYVDAGRVPNVQDCQLQQVEDYTVKASGNTITLTPKTLEASSVSFWLLDYNK